MTNPFGHEITWSTGVVLPDMPGAGLFATGMAGLVVASRRTGRAQTRMLLAAALPHSRSPVYRETYDEVIGFVHVRDLLDPVLTGRTEPLS